MNVQIITNNRTGRGNFFIKCGLQSWWHKSSCNSLSYGEAKHLDTCCLFCLERENWKPDIIQLNQKLRSCIKFKADYGDTEGFVQKTTVSCTNLCWLTSELRGTALAPPQIEISRQLYAVLFQLTITITKITLLVWSFDFQLTN